MDYFSSLTAPPAFKFALAPSFCKCTKLFVVVSLLNLFTHFTFAQEAKVNPNDYVRLNGPRRRQEMDGDEDLDFDMEDDIEPMPMESLPTQSDDFVDNGNITRTHEHNIIRGMAQDRFFHLTERNYYESMFQTSFLDWTVENRERYLAARSIRPSLELVTFFAEDVLAWSGMYCSSEIEGGCTNMPPPEYVRTKLSTQRHKARQVTLTLEALRAEYASRYIVKQGLQAALAKVSGHCEDFTRTFFHEATHHKHSLCIAQILAIVVAVIGAIISVFLLPMALASLVATPLLMGITSASAWISTFTWLAAAIITTGTTIAVPAIFRPNKDDPYRKNYGLNGQDPLPPASAVFLQTEWFPVDQLSSTTADGSSLYDQMTINSTSWLATNASQNPVIHIPQDKSVRTAHRVSLGYSIHAKRGLQASPTAKLPASWDLGFRVARRLQDRDGTPMDLAGAISFHERHGRAIEAFEEKLRKPDAEFLDTDVPLLPMVAEADFRIESYVSYIPWHTVLGGIKFDGITSTGAKGNEIPEMRVKAGQTLTEPRSKSWKRNAQVSDAAITHHVLGAAESIESLGLAGPYQSRKRSTGWSIDREDDMYTVKLDKTYFRNDIEHKMCGIDDYTGDQTKNLKACKTLLGDVVNTIIKKMDRADHERNNLDRWLPGSPAPLAISLAKRFTSYSSFYQAAHLAPQRAAFEEKVYANMKNGLVSKAYADEHCYIRCTGKGPRFGGIDTKVYQLDGSDCRAGCFDPTEQRFEGLYGLTQKNSKAKREPWNLNETDIVLQSVRAYRDRNPEAWLPGMFNLDPWSQNIKDRTPVLLVCNSDWQGVSGSNSYIKGIGTLPFVCGNKYGNETDLVWAGTRLIADGRRDEYAMLRNMLGAINYMAYRDPAAYLINACRAVYNIVPPGSGSYQEAKNKGHYKENHVACGIYNRFLNDHKDKIGKDEAFLNRNMCKIWARRAKDFDRGGNHNHPDMSYVNDMVEDNGCSGYRHWWKYDCKKGKHLERCDYLRGY